MMCHELVVIVLKIPRHFELDQFIKQKKLNSNESNIIQTNIKEAFECTEIEAIFRIIKIHFCE